MKTKEKISKAFCEGYEAQYKPDAVVIAEFMGVEFKKDHTTRKYWHYQELGLASDKLCFDTSWDWLMPVVEKIDSLRLIDGDLQLWDSKREDVLDLKINSKIETVYKVVVEFIKWYNEQPK